MPRSHHLLASVLILLAAGPSGAQQTVGLFQNDPGSFNGYTLFGASSSNMTYLIDNNGNEVHSWQNTGGAHATGYLQPNGDILRPGNSQVDLFGAPGSNGKIQRADWDANVLWEWEYSDTNHITHHDIQLLPNGNIVAIAWERRSLLETIDAGRDPTRISQGELWPDTVIEVQPIGTDSAVIVWEWRVFDHLVQDFDSTKANFGVVEDHPELVDINYGNTSADWNHMNAIHYNPDLDQIALSVNGFHEFWVIDHSTTTAEAAGHVGGNSGKGGDLLYRWGNPAAYSRGTGADQNNWRNHDIQWIDPGLPGEGDFLFYNNGNGRPAGAYSSVEQFTPPVDVLGNYAPLLPGAAHSPSAADWVFTTTPPESLYGMNTSSCQRLPNGNTLICEGPSGTFWETDSTGTIVWKYVNPVNAAGPMAQGTTPTGNGTFRVRRFAPTYSAFAGRDLTPMGPIELLPSAVSVAEERGGFALAQNSPNPFRSGTTIRYTLPVSVAVTLEVHHAAGRLVRVIERARRPAGAHEVAWDRRDAGGAPVAAGVYFYRLQAEGYRESRKMVVLR